jgi:hypothetical protein
MNTVNRRIFFGSEELCFKLFSFKQTSKGDIYVSMPDFCNTDWLSIKETNGVSETVIHEGLLDDGKLSIHNIGIAHYRSNSNPKDHRFQIFGQHLYNESIEKKLGIRHLLSAFPQEPTFIPRDSPYKNRNNDYLIVDELKPVFIIFYAIPISVDTTFKVGYDIDEDDLVDKSLIFNYGSFSLLYHNVLWICYRTKYLETWPGKSYLSYTDGIRLPFFVGIGPSLCRLEMRIPELSIADKVVSIHFRIPEGLKSE